MGGGVPTLISGHRSVILRHYIIFIKTRRLLLLHLVLVYPPPLIPKTHRHHKVKYWPRINVLGHTSVTVGNELPNRLQFCVCQFLTNGGLLPCSVPALRHPDINLPHHSIFQATQCPQDAGCYDPRLQSEEQHRLDLNHVEHTSGPGAIPLLSQQAV